MKIISRLFIGIFLMGQLSSCFSKGGSSDGFNIGFSADVSKQVFVNKAVFDNRWQVPVGQIGCCRGNAGAISGVIPAAPRRLYLEWLDIKSGEKYSANLIFTQDIEVALYELPHYYLVNQKEYRKPIPYIITSIDQYNGVTSWLSNSRSDGDNIQERVLIELAQDSGSIINHSKP